MSGVSRGQRYWTTFYDDPEEARADATAQITEQLKGTWRERSGPRMLLEEWIDIWVTMLGDIEPTTKGKYKYLVEAHFLPAFQGRQLGSLTFKEIEAWDAAISTRISARGRPFARSVAFSARSLLITILGDAVHAGKLERNPAERRKGRRGRVRAKGRTPSHAVLQTAANVITPLQALCLAERCALLSGQDMDFVMNVFATWTGVRWGELLAVEGAAASNSPLHLDDNGISTYALDWQLREFGGVVRKSPPKDGSYRVLDLPPFLAELTRWAVASRPETCACPLADGRPSCKGDDRTSANYLFLGPRGGHPRRSNYADDFITPAAEGLHPTRQGIRRPVYVTAEPWPGLPIRRGDRKHKTADLAEGTWPNLTGKFRPHDYRHTHATWLDDAGLSKVIQMDPAATRCRAWTASTRTSRRKCDGGSATCSKTCGAMRLRSAICWPKRPLSPSWTRHSPIAATAPSAELVAGRQATDDTGIVKRERAALLLEHVLRALDERQGDWPMSLVTGLYVFGSFARGAVEPHDVDLDVEFEGDERWAEHFVGCLSYGRDPHSPIRRMLTDGKRGCQFQFNFLQRADFDMTLLWRKADTLQTALARLNAIQADSAAGRAPRDAMLPQFEGLDRWIPLAYREAMSGAVSNGAVTIERCVLPDGAISSATALDHVSCRWQPTSPLNRAASAVVADWERRGIDPCQGHLHGSDIRDRETPYFAGFGLRHFTSVPACLTEFGGVEWLEVIRPTRTRQLDTLRIQPRDRKLLKRVSWL